VGVLGKIFGGPGPSSFGRQQRLSEITIEPIKNLGGLGKFGWLCPALGGLGMGGWPPRPDSPRP